jgi:hypothetical protein
VDEGFPDDQHRQIKSGRAIIEKYGSAYTEAFRNVRGRELKIDGFSGAGVHVVRSIRQRR